ncbi:28S ribosomal protein S18a, mitochondrial-like [Amphibalanus amphitrite]|uniref:28S ribosomal protein S18a, mitochondrial-like n=1 Tax=Amphibalanus amphitrite TaxID=1232801 RepID=UPI001C8FCB60|nr:28S ribosomal protein S18a, mitochondrial-like [Amphibalanus amphitrite]
MSLVWRRAVCATARTCSAMAQHKTLCTARPALVKQIVCAEEGNVTVIQGRVMPSPRENRVVQTGGGTCACPLCQLHLDIKHTDVLILSQFLRSDGCLLPRRVSGVCRLQQRRVQQLVAMAQKAGLMPNLAPSSSKRDPRRRFGFKKFNKYYDESTIRDVQPFSSAMSAR